MKVILKDKYVDYESALELLDLDSLHERRAKLCLKFAKKCLKIENLKKLFPYKKTKHDMKKRKYEKFFISNINTERYKRSAVPEMKRMLNEEEFKMRKAMKDINTSMSPENIVNFNPISVKI